MKKYYLQNWFKVVYLASAIIFWLGLGVICHALIEYPLLFFLTKNFTLYSMGISYDAWLSLHTVFSFLVLCFSLSAGIYFGLIWYDYIYIKYEGRIGYKFFKK